MKEKLLLIAEKPSLMNELKDVYTKNKGKIPYNIDFIALAGHICGYSKPDAYSEWKKPWQELDSLLPMIPEKWKIDVLGSKKDLYKTISKKIKDGKYDGFICATDADREGNLIYYLLENKIGCSKKKTYRLWLNDLTEKAILKAFGEMKDLHKDTSQVNLTHASILRSRFDWLVGMNISVSASVHSNMVMKIGRVKTPTLKLVYDNSKAIDEFESVTTFGVDVNYIEGFSGTYINEDGEVRFKTEKEAKDFLAKLGKKAKVVSVEKNKVSTYAPELFKLSDIQVYAGKTYGYSPDKTLDLVQKLYEKKLLTYPRCDCRVVSTETTKSFPNLLKSVSCIPEFSDFVKKISKSDIDRASKSKKYVNDVEVNKNSHTALIPTEQKPNVSSLSKDELNILKTVYARFLAIFLPPTIEEKTVLIADIDKCLFKSNGKKTLSLGFASLYNKKPEDIIIPDNIKKGDNLNVKEFEVKEKTTVPPARLTESELIRVMENISKYINDKELKEVMKSAKGIGTPSSRASIIKSLIADGYIDVKTQKKASLLFISPKGKQYIENLTGFDIVSPELTAVWEDKLRQIERGERNSVEFSSEMNEFLRKTIDKINSASMQKVSYSSNLSVVGKCPRCGCDIVETPKAFSCTGYKNSPACKFAIWKNNKLLSASNKKLTAAKVKKLLSSGKYEEKGLVSKSGKKYNAVIVLEDTGDFVGLKLTFPQK